MCVLTYFETEAYPESNVNIAINPSEYFISLFSPTDVIELRLCFDVSYIQPRKNLAVGSVADK